MKTIFMRSIAVLLCLLAFQSFAQTSQYQFPLFDVQHYTFQISLNDNNNQIEGTTTIRLNVLQNLQQIELDLVKKAENGMGMIVTSVSNQQTAYSFLQTAQKLIIQPTSILQKVCLYTAFLPLSWRELWGE